jgi:glucose/arabinose dehydrogenase
MNDDTTHLTTAWLRPARAGTLAAFLVLAALRPASGAEADAEADAGSNIGLKLIAEGLSAPMALASLPDGSGRLLVAEQSGVISLLDRDGKKSEQPFLDLRAKMVAINKGMEERGLLGLALHPQFKSNHKFYAVYSAPRRTNAPSKWDHTQRLSEFKTTDADSAAADPASERVVLEIDEPDWNHNSGRLAFGPDGFLYLSVGDGGAHYDVGDAARGRGHPPEGNGQKLDTLLGKVLRLDVDRGNPYGIPRDNPYADGKKGLPEIFACGLRNPWGMSFDRGGRHGLILADVGQDRWEEINVIVNGGRRGAGSLGGDQCHRQRRQLRLALARGFRWIRSQQPAQRSDQLRERRGRREAVHRSRHRLQDAARSRHGVERIRSHRHRRLRVSRQGVPVARRQIRLRRLVA